VDLVAGLGAELSSTIQRLDVDLVYCDESHEFADVAVHVVLAEKVNVPALVDLPVILLDRVAVLGGHEDQIGEQPRRATVAVHERMDPHRLGVGDDPELA
jgi:hypothetical protein